MLYARTLRRGGTHTKGAPRGGCGEGIHPGRRDVSDPEYRHDKTVDLLDDGRQDLSVVTEDSGYHGHARPAIDVYPFSSVRRQGLPAGVGAC